MRVIVARTSAGVSHSQSVDSTRNTALPGPAMQDNSCDIRRASILELVQQIGHFEKLVQT